MVSQCFVFLTRCSDQQANNTIKLSLASFLDRCRASVCDVCHHLVVLWGLPLGYDDSEPRNNSVVFLHVAVYVHKKYIRSGEWRWTLRELAFLCYIYII